MSSSLSFLKFLYGASINKPSPSSPKRLPTTKSTTESFRHPTIDEMNSVFDKFDEDKDGKITQEEYRSVLRVMYTGRSSRRFFDLGAAFQEADFDGDGLIDCEEFLGIHIAMRRRETGVPFQVPDFHGADGDDSDGMIMEQKNRFLDHEATNLMFQPAVHM